LNEQRHWARQGNDDFEEAHGSGGLGNVVAQTGAELERIDSATRHRNGHPCLPPWQMLFSREIQLKHGRGRHLIIQDELCVVGHRHVGCAKHEEPWSAEVDVACSALHGERLQLAAGGAEERVGLQKPFHQERRVIRMRDARGGDQ
jgi:hypothetical protein